MKKIAYIAVVALAVVACNKEEGAKTLTVTPAEKTVFTDEDLPELSVSATPENALDGVTVEWTSSDPELVTVSPKGELALTVEDIEEKEKVVTITAKAGELSATCKLTIKGQIARYEVLDFTKDFGFKMLDRNIGAKSKEDAGYFYQWGKILPVASGNDTKVNEFYDKDWSPESKGFADWTVAENTPCPKGWSLPAGDKLTKLNEYRNVIQTYEFEWWVVELDEDKLTYTREQYNAAKAKFDSFQFVATGKFAYYTKDENRFFGKTNLDGQSFWFGENGVKEDKDEETGETTKTPFAKYYEYMNDAPSVSQGDYTTAVPVRCVK